MENNTTNQPNKKLWLYGGIAFAVLLLLFLWFFFRNSKTSENEIITYNPAFDNYISAYTNGEISRKSTIKIRFQEEIVAFEEIDKVLKSNLIEFSPKIKGDSKWLDTRTLEFVTATPLPSAQVFIAKIELDELLNTIPDSLANFRFQFHTKAQDFAIEYDGIKTPDPSDLAQQTLQGTILTDDFETNGVIETFFSANQKGTDLKIEWQHLYKNKHLFTVVGIKRLEKESDVIVHWDGDKLKLDDRSGEQKFSVKALGDFTLVNSYVHLGNDRYISLEFSDPLDPNQNLKGLISVKGSKIATIIEGNHIKVYPKNASHGEFKVTINAGIKNSAGSASTYSSTLNLYISQEKPEVRLIGKGNIIPKTAGKIPFVFETKNLDAVDIRVVKIFEKNVQQFFQVNQIGGSQELKRVGQEVARQKVSLKGQNKNLGQWCTHTVDLNKIISPEPGAIYEIGIGFQKGYSLYNCKENDDEEEVESTEEVQDMLELKHWDNPNRNYWGYYYGNYSDRKNPCKEAYYNKSRVVTRNILASSLGIIAKGDKENNFSIAVSDINTAKPLANTKVEFYDFQHQLINSGTTNSSGLVKVNLKRNPFLLIAKKDKERGYLRLDDGNNISFSRFDVSGKSYHQGIKGFIYGERGVWRPGDTLFLTFVLEDKKMAIPANHPVTFELFDPNDKLVNKLVTKQNTKGFYSYKIATRSDAPTGNYQVKAHIGGTTFQKSLKIETIVPNRLKIKFDIDEKTVLSSKSKSVKMITKWLHGAKAGNLKADVKVTLKQMTTVFDNYGNFNFDNPLMRFNAEEKTIFDSKLDANGEASIPLRFTIDDQAPGRLKAQFKTKVFEAGGGFSVDRFSAPYDPYNEYVGIHTPKGDNRGILVTDKDHVVELVVLNKEGKPLANKTIEIELYRLQWRWWWDYYNESADFDFRSRNNYSSIKKAKVTTDANGLAKWNINIKENNWGRFLVNATIPNGHSTGKIIYVDWPSWSSRTKNNANSEGATMLLVSSDKKEYQTDEKVTVSFPSSEGAKALISIETGNKIIETHWVNTKKGETRFTFNATKSMTPNIYVYVALLQPHEKTKNDLPLRMYGILPLKIVNPATLLHPVLTMPTELKPEETVRIKVSEKDNKAMTYTLAIVDEGLLDLTKFKTPEIWSHFNKKQALSIKTWDLYNQVIASRKGQIKNILTIGGDGEVAGSEKDKSQNRFKAMVRFIGPFHLNSHQTKTHQISIPNYVGSVRTMVIAGDNGAYGNTEKTTPVRKPLMVLPALSRVIGPGEVVNIPVTVFAMDNKIKKVKVTIQTNAFFELQDEATKEVIFTEMGDKIVYFKVKIAEAVGKGFVKFDVSSANEKAHYETYIDVRNPNPVLKEFYKETLSAGKKEWKQSIQSFGVDGTNNLSLEVSALYPINLENRLNYLIRYPYGCVEQTTSSVFPQLHLNKYVHLSPKKQKEIEKNIKSGIQRLTEFQTYSGGLSYWPGGQWENAWGTNYAGHFLLEAENSGYHVPSAFKTNWIAYQTRMAENFGSSSREWEQTTQAYRLYLLAMAKKPVLGAMNRLKQRHTRYNMASWYLAGAYELVGQHQVARDLASNLSIPNTEYRHLGYTYGSDSRDKAIILSISALLKKKTTSEKLVKDLCYKLADNERYMSTQTTAYSLVAIAHYLNMRKSGTLKFQYRIDKGDWLTITDDKTIWTKMIKIDQGPHDIELKNLTEHKLHPRITVEGQPMPNQHTAEKNVNNRLIMSINYTQNGKQVNPKNIKQGTDVKIEVYIRNPSNQDYQELALAHIFPSGWEVHNQRMDNSTNNNYAQPEYMDIRDDRVNLFFDLKAKKSKTFSYTISGSYAGDYYLPSIVCQAMYDNSIYASQTGKWVKVVR